DLGAPTIAPAGSRDNGRPVGLAALLLRPSGLFLIALVLFGIVLTAKLWREGRFDPLFAPKSAKVEPGRKGWMLGDKLPPPPMDKSAVNDPVYADAPKPKTTAEPAGDGESAQ
ncbi:MAG: hypothetical protein H0X36_15550, partial [Sphingomonadaceae bacterium]|nr:hypothetical protein [Sphingomonadaceae bacterium]